MVGVLPRHRRRSTQTLWSRPLSEKSTFYSLRGQNHIHREGLSASVCPPTKIGTPRRLRIPTAEAGEKCFRIWDGEPHAPDSTVLEWFTTEKLIWDRSRGYPGITGFNRYNEAAKYDLLYVGIAKVGDSFDRLISNGHKARMQILGNEPQRYPGARVTDEIYLFLLKVQPVIMTTFEPDHDFENEDFSGAYDHKRIVADAEKAFVSLLQPEYNVVKFTSYPKGKDGLYGSDYTRYGYAICETITLDTAHGRFRGSRDARTNFINNNADSIFVDGQSVKLYVSGVDYPSEQEPAASPAPDNA
ncbi:hypothetical protein IE4803_PA00106 (plasmid) [Rhizobium etli bv. phaseoli str. IE4803]|nr:hypothetical protein IE4803_PA00106 [Rhizobium etli bv. phaseoli str. IE4803]